MKRLIAILVVIVFCLAGAALAQAQGNPFVGTWKMDPEKSKASPSPGPKEETRVVEVQGDSVKGSYEGTAANGSRIAYGYTAKYDSKDYPLTGMGTPDGADTLALKRINTNIYEVTAKRGGNVVMTARVVVSKDGKVTTITTKGTDASGKPDSSVRVFDKQ
jgi:hypothetical protein